MQRKTEHHNHKTMSKFEIPYLNACIKAFGDRFSLSRENSYDYLKRHAGLAFLIEFYDVEHLQSIEDTVDDLIVMCKNNTPMITQPTKQQMKEYLISKTIDYMVTCLVEEHKMSLDEALDIVYKSEVIRLLQIPEGELYVQSPGYVYELLSQELAMS